MNREKAGWCDRCSAPQIVRKVRGENLYLCDGCSRAKLRRGSRSSDNQSVGDGAAGGVHLFPHLIPHDP